MSENKSRRALLRLFGAAPALAAMAALLDALDAPEGVAIAVRAHVRGHQRRGA